MEEFEFDVDFGDDIIVNPETEEQEVEQLQVDSDPSDQNDFDTDEIIEEDTLDEESENEESDVHQLFIEGWRDTGFLVLPENYDAKDKTVTDVMKDHAANVNELLKQSFYETLPEDMREAARLSLEGKISNAKEYLSYQVQAETSIGEVSNTEDARKFLEKYYKENTDLDADDIEQTLDSLELKDKLVEKATSLKSKVEEKNKQDIEAKKQQLLQKEAEVKAAKEREMSERITKVKTFIERSNWTAEHKKFVQDEISQGMKTTVSNIQAAITDPEVTPEFVSLMSRILVKDDAGKVSISKESLKEFASSKVAKELKSNWESKLDKSNLPKGASKTGKQMNSKGVVYNLDGFDD